MSLFNYSELEQKKKYGLFLNLVPFIILATLALLIKMKKYDICMVTYHTRMILFTAMASSLFIGTILCLSD